MTRASSGALHAVAGGASAVVGDPDRELAQRFATGDRDVMRDLYARYAGPVYTIAMRRLGDPRLAEEAVQDAFVKAWRGAHTYDPERSLSPWLYQIARHAAEDVARREHRHHTTVALSAGTPGDESLSLGDAWEAWQVRTALSELSGEERELVRLTHYVGLSQSQIAEQLGIPIGTVKSRVHRAHNRLAARLAHLRGSN